MRFPTPHRFRNHGADEPPDARLHALLDEWHEVPEVSPGFEARLQRRLEAAPPKSAWLDVWLRRLAPLGQAPVAAMAVMAVAAMLGTWLWVRPAAVPMTAPVTAVQVARVDPMVRDLQALNNYGDLLENLDFLSTPTSAGVSAPHLQDQD